MRTKPNFLPEANMAVYSGIYVPVSAGGDATKASAEKGETVLKSAIEGTGQFLAELSKAPDSETFPY